MRTAYFDCFSGASGDMIVGALVDAGVSIEHLESQLRTLPISGYEIGARKITKQGLSATKFDVRFDEQQPHRNLGEVTRIIRSGKLEPRTVEQACSIFERLAQAEATVHATTVDKVHFHEVGAIDAIVDVVGSCLALRDLGIERIMCSPIPTGSGTVRCAHGLLPVPAPATALLLKGVPIAGTDEVGELTTPTGAAILTSLASSFGPCGGLCIEHIGYGAGLREGRQRPNVLRVMVGQAAQRPASDQIAVLEASIDDQSPEILGYAVERLIEQGALDAYMQPIYMKKGRPGVLLTVLCAAHQIDAMEAVVFAETSTFGIRRQLMQRTTLDRRFETVSLPDGDVRIKVGSRNGQVTTVSPEFEDCRILAEKSGRSVRQVMSLALKYWNER